MDLSITRKWQLSLVCAAMLALQTGCDSSENTSTVLSDGSTYSSTQVSAQGEDSAAKDDESDTGNDDSSSSSSSSDTDSSSSESDSSNSNTSSSSNADSVTNSFTVDVDGESRKYYVRVPNRADGGSMPVVFNYHDYGDTPSRHERITNMSDLADDRGFIAVYPEGEESYYGGLYWNTTNNSSRDDELEFFDDILDALKADYAVDDTRVYATGYGSGAGMANLLAFKRPNTVAAVAFVAGEYDYFLSYTTEEPVPLMVFHGNYASPQIEDWMEKRVDQNGCNASAESLVVTGDITRQQWSGCESQVVLYTIDDYSKGDAWPGSDASSEYAVDDIDASELMLDFFEGYSR